MYVITCNRKHYGLSNDPHIINTIKTLRPKWIVYVKGIKKGILLKKHNFHLVKITTLKFKLMLEIDPEWLNWWNARLKTWSSVVRIPVQVQNVLLDSDINNKNK